VTIILTIHSSSSLLQEPQPLHISCPALTDHMWTISWLPCGFPSGKPNWNQLTNTRKQDDTGSGE